MTLVKICGIRTPAALDAALDAGADMIGLVRFARSPRHVTLDEGRAISARAKGKALRVALLVDPNDHAIADTIAALDPDLLQLHGGETPARVADIRKLAGRPVMKALGIADPDDLSEIEDYRKAADRLILDAKPPRGSEALPGGNGLVFDWRLIAGLDPDLAFMLSGGLTPDNVAAAIALTKATGVDVSSGVETAPGEKCPEKIAAFVAAVRSTPASRRQPEDQVA